MVSSLVLRLSLAGYHSEYLLRILYVVARTMKRLSQDSIYADDMPLHMINKLQVMINS